MVIGKAMQSDTECRLINLSESLYCFKHEEEYFMLMKNCGNWKTTKRIVLLRIPVSYLALI